MSSNFVKFRRGVRRLCVQGQGQWARILTLICMTLRHKGQRGDGDSLLNERFGLLGLGLSVDGASGAITEMYRAGFMGEIHADIIGIGFDLLF